MPPLYQASVVVHDKLGRRAQEGSSVAAWVEPSAAPSAHAHEPWLQRYGSALRSALPARDYDHLLPAGWGLGSGKGVAKGPSTTGEASSGMLSHLLPPGWGSGADQSGTKGQDAANTGSAGAFGRLLLARWRALLGKASAEGTGAAEGSAAGAKPPYGAPVPTPHLDRALARVRAWWAAMVGPWGGRMPGSGDWVDDPASPTTAQGREGPVARGAEWVTGTAAQGAGWVRGGAAAAGSAAQEALARLHTATGLGRAAHPVTTVDPPQGSGQHGADGALAAAQHPPSSTQTPSRPDKVAGTADAEPPGEAHSPPAAAHDSMHASPAAAGAERAAGTEQPQQTAPGETPEKGAPALSAAQTLLRTALRSRPAEALAALSHRAAGAARSLLAQGRALAGQGKAWVARIASADRNVSMRLAARARTVLARMAGAVRARTAALAGMLPGLRAGWGPAAGAALAGALVLAGAGALLGRAPGRSEHQRQAAAAGEGRDAVGELCQAANRRRDAPPSLRIARTSLTPLPGVMISSALAHPVP